MSDTQLYETWNKNPQNRVSGGTVDGTSLDVCKALYNSNYHPGKYYAPNCNIGYGGEEKSLSDFLLLDSNKNFKWTKNPSKKVVGGSEGGKTLYVCRGYHGNGMNPGKTWDDYEKCNIGWGGKEHTLDDFEYLSYDCGGDNMFFTSECDSEGNNQGTDTFKKRKSFCNSNSTNAYSTKCMDWCKNNSTHCTLLNTLNDCKQYNIPNKDCSTQTINTIVTECKSHGMLSEQGLPIGSYPCTADGIDSFKTACKFYNLVPGSTCNATALDNAKLASQSQSQATAAAQQSQQQYDETRKALSQVLNLPSAPTPPPASSSSPPTSSSSSSSTTLSPSNSYVMYGILVFVVILLFSMFSSSLVMISQTSD